MNLCLFVKKKDARERYHTDWTFPMFDRGDQQHDQLRLLIKACHLPLPSNTSPCKGFWKGDHSKGVSSYYRIIMHHHQLPDNPPPLYQVPLWYVPHPSMRACRGLGLGWSPKGGDCHDIPVNLSELVRLPRHKSQSLRLLTSRSSLGKRHVLLQGFLIHECLRMGSSENYFFYTIFAASFCRTYIQ